MAALIQLFRVCVERTESVAMYPLPLVLALLLVRRSLTMLRTVLAPQGAVTVETRSKESR